MSSKKYVHIFPWMKYVNTKLLSLFGTGDAEDINLVLQELYENVSMEISDLASMKINRIKKLCTVLSDYLFNFHMQSIVSETGIWTRSHAFIGLMSLLLELYIYLGVNTSSPFFIENAVRDILLYLGEGNHLAWDVLLQCRLLTKQYAEACCPILNRIMVKIPDVIPKPCQYLKLVILLRLWKTFSPPGNAKKEIVAMASRIKSPDNVIQWFTRLPVRGIRKLSIPPGKKLVKFLFKNGFPNGFFKRLRFVLSESPHVTESYPPISLDSVCLDVENQEDVLFFDKSQLEGDCNSKDDSSPFDEITVNSGDTQTVESSSAFGNTENCGRKYKSKHLRSKNINGPHEEAKISGSVKDVVDDSLQCEQHDNIQLEPLVSVESLIDNKDRKSKKFKKNISSGKIGKHLIKIYDDTEIDAMSQPYVNDKQAFKSLASGDNKTTKKICKPKKTKKIISPHKKNVSSTEITDIVNTGPQYDSEILFFIDKKHSADSCDLKNDLQEDQLETINKPKLPLGSTETEELESSVVLSTTKISKAKKRKKKARTPNKIHSLVEIFDAVEKHNELETSSEQEPFNNSQEQQSGCIDNRNSKRPNKLKRMEIAKVNKKEYLSKQRNKTVVQASGRCQEELGENENIQLQTSDYMSESKSNEENKKIKKRKIQGEKKRNRKISPNIEMDVKHSSPEAQSIEHLSEFSTPKSKKSRKSHVNIASHTESSSIGELFREEEEVPNVECDPSILLNTESFPKDQCISERGESRQSLEDEVVQDISFEALSYSEKELGKLDLKLSLFDNSNISPSTVAEKRKHSTSLSQSVSSDHFEMNDDIQRNSLIASSPSKLRRSNRLKTQIGFKSAPGTDKCQHIETIDYHISPSPKRKRQLKKEISNWYNDSELQNQVNLNQNDKNVDHESNLNDSSNHDNSLHVTENNNAHICQNQVEMNRVVATTIAKVKSNKRSRIDNQSSEFDITLTPQASFIPKNSVTPENDNCDISAFSKDKNLKLFADVLMPVEIKDSVIALKGENPNSSTTCVFERENLFNSKNSSPTFISEDDILLDSKGNSPTAPVSENENLPDSKCNSPTTPISENENLPDSKCNSPTTYISENENLPDSKCNSPVIPISENENMLDSKSDSPTTSISENENLPDSKCNSPTTFISENENLPDSKCNSPVIPISENENMLDSNYVGISNSPMKLVLSDSDDDPDTFHSGTPEIEESYKTISVHEQQGEKSPQYMNCEIKQDCNIQVMELKSGIIDRENDNMQSLKYDHLDLQLPRKDNVKMNNTINEESAVSVCNSTINVGKKNSELDSISNAHAVQNLIDFICTDAQNSPLQLHNSPEKEKILDLTLKKKNMSINDSTYNQTPVDSPLLLQEIVEQQSSSTNITIMESDSPKPLSDHDIQKDSHAVSSSSELTNKEVPRVFSQNKQEIDQCEGFKIIDPQQSCSPKEDKYLNKEIKSSSSDLKFEDGKVNSNENDQIIFPQSNVQNSPNCDVFSDNLVSIANFGTHKHHTETCKTVTSVVLMKSDNESCSGNKSDIDNYSVNHDTYAKGNMPKGKNSSCSSVHLDESKQEFSPSTDDPTEAEGTLKLSTELEGKKFCSPTTYDSKDQNLLDLNHDCLFDRPMKLVLSDSNDNSDTLHFASSEENEPEIYSKPKEKGKLKCIVTPEHASRNIQEILHNDKGNVLFTVNTPLTPQKKITEIGPILKSSPGQKLIDSTFEDIENSLCTLNKSKIGALTPINQNSPNKSISESLSCKKKVLLNELSFKCTPVNSPFSPVQTAFIEVSPAVDNPKLSSDKAESPTIKHVTQMSPLKDLNQHVKALEEPVEEGCKNIKTSSRLLCVIETPSPKHNIKKDHCSSMHRQSPRFIKQLPQKFTEIKIPSLDIGSPVACLSETSKIMAEKHLDFSDMKIANEVSVGLNDIKNCEKPQNRKVCSKRECSDFITPGKSSIWSMRLRKPKTPVTRLILQSKNTSEDSATTISNDESSSESQSTSNLEEIQRKDEKLAAALDSIFPPPSKQCSLKETISNPVDSDLDQSLKQLCLRSPSLNSSSVERVSEVSSVLCHMSDTCSGLANNPSEPTISALKTSTHSSISEDKSVPSVSTQRSCALKSAGKSMPKTSKGKSGIPASRAKPIEAILEADSKLSEGKCDTTASRAKPIEAISETNSKLSGGKCDTTASRAKPIEAVSEADSKLSEGGKCDTTASRAKPIEAISETNSKLSGGKCDTTASRAKPIEAVSEADSKLSEGGYRLRPRRSVVQPAKLSL